MAWILTCTGISRAHFVHDGGIDAISNLLFSVIAWPSQGSFVVVHGLFARVQGWELIWSCNIWLDYGFTFSANPEQRVCFAKVCFCVVSGLMSGSRASILALQDWCSTICQCNIMDVSYMCVDVHWCSWICQGSGIDVYGLSWMIKDLSRKSHRCLRSVDSCSSSIAE